MKRQVDISKILAKGSAKQRVLLYFNNLGEYNRVIDNAAGGAPIRKRKGFLTETEERNLIDSIKKGTSAEINLYKTCGRLEELLDKQEPVLMATMFQYRETIASLTGYCLLYHGYTEFADTLSGLYFSMKTPKEKKTILDYLENHKRYLWADIGPAKDPDKNGIKVSPGRENTKKPPRKNPEDPKIKDLLAVLSRRAEDQLRIGKTIIKILRDIIEETGFKLDVHIEAIDKIENDFKEDKAPLPKFSKKKTEEQLLTIADSPEQKRRMEEIFGPNWYFPNYETVEIDEAFYNMLYGNMLGRVEGKGNV